MLLAGENTINSFKELIALIKRYLLLKADYLRLTATEKLTMFMGSMTLYGFMAFMSVLSIIFIINGLIHLLGTVLPLWSAYLIIAGALLLIMLLVFALRRILIYNPLARFLSRRILRAPETAGQHQHA